MGRFLMRMLPGIVIAAIFWFLSTLPFVDAWNHIPLVEQLGLNFRTTFVTIGAIALMFPVIQLAFVAPLNQAMDDRTKRLEDTYAEAETLKQRMTDLKSSYEEKLVTAEAEARDKIQVALGEAQEMKGRIIEEARGQAEEIGTRANEELRREREKMLVDLRTHVVDLTMTATRKVIGESVDETKQRELVERFIETAEVGK
ncbi:MAG: F0F1 ATP synthase subunit B [Armatimonadota bacterium]|nr:F0F1 ATP synthase subunit B [Armatimonadota bacterium]